jgi:spermidine/putrescine transport system ATP-binding protein
LGPGVSQGSEVKLYVRPEHCTLQKGATKQLNAVPVEVSDSAFEGNFINVFLIDSTGATHMAQMHNDPSAPPPPKGSKVSMVFSADHAVLLAEARTRS